MSKSNGWEVSRDADEERPFTISTIDRVIVLVDRVTGKARIADGVTEEEVRKVLCFAAEWMAKTGPRV